ncbi:MAG: sugar phosphate nucleotidyltransferase [candidate division WOR-3 bacterium]|nr:sugar phosphate nucleotidyltransferase [candidate division WOR-3 bacterium]MCX7947718.1 sugar phosphate nucleotidyltransferase [candidate division WOR-3 bacterium]MDW8150359.1 sugar phosphate nucleotidyltransferase [candidate division WOR-3 bacterium]
MKTISIILAGGKGERFWPISRRNKPKQLLDIFTGKPLILEAYERAKKIGEVFIITTKDIEEPIRELTNDDNIISEPTTKNTAPAIYYAINEIKNLRDEDIIVIQTADHIIGNIPTFMKNINLGIEVAKKDYIVVFGIVPNRPETGFGYIEISGEVYKNVYKVIKFHEKPSIEKAMEYISKGNFYWNSGMFIFKKSVILDAYETYAKDIVLAYRRSRNIQEFYHVVNNISIDHAIMEKVRNLALIRAEFYWEDAGSYISLESLFKKDENGNIVIGDAVLIDVKNCIIISKDGICAVYGIENSIIVKTFDSTLVIPKSKAQNVKEIVELLKKLKLDKYL